MKKLILFFTLFIFFAGCSKSESSPQENVNAEKNPPEKTSQSQTVDWMNFNAGLEKGNKENKFILVDFYADWCGWCRLMETEVFLKPEIDAKLKKDFIMVKIDIEKEESLKYKSVNYTNKEFANAMQVQGLPTLAVFTSDGEPLTIIPGYIDAVIFSQLLDYFSKEIFKKNISFEQYQKTLIK